MILRFHAAVRAALTDTLLRLYALEPAAIPSLVLEAPPSRAMGDLACPVAFELARRLRKAPRAIAAPCAAGGPARTPPDRRGRPSHGSAAPPARWTGSRRAPARRCGAACRWGRRGRPRGSAVSRGPRF